MSDDALLDQQARQFLGTPHDETEVAARQLLGPPPSGSLFGQAWDSFFRAQGPSYRAYNQAYDEAFGKTPLGIQPPAYHNSFGQPVDKTHPDARPNLGAWLQDNGLFGDYEKGQSTWAQKINEGLLRPAAVAGDYAMRALYANARGAAAQLPETPGQMLLHPLSTIEGAIGGRLSAILEGALPEGAPLHHGVATAAADVGLLEPHWAKTPEAVAREKFAPPQPSTAEALRRAEQEAAPTAAPTTIHEAAREIEPDLMTQYDALTETKNQYLNMINEEAQLPREPSDAARQLQASLEEARTERQRERLQTRLDAQIAEDEAAAKERLDTLRQEMNTVDAQLREIAPDVNEAHRRARESMAEPPPITYEDVIKRAREELAVEQRGSKAEQAPPQAPAEPSKTPVSPTDLDFLQRRPTITASIASRLTALGMDVEEAQANGRLWQAHYEARAARFNGALGSARDLFEKDDVTIERGKGKAQGKYSISRNEIRLMQNADASTFAHESMHNWLEELQRDARDERAPQELKDDLQAVRDWVKAKGEGFTRKEHELVARGFERYLMEGVAPSTRLAKVFAQFKDWLTKIYQSVARIPGIALNDSIRGFYDRMLATQREGTIIAPDREVTGNLAEMHEADLATATPENALDVAKRMRQERDLASETLKTEVNSARQRYRTASETRAAAREAAARSTGGEPLAKAEAPAEGVVAERAQPPESTVEVSPSGATFKAESTVNPDGSLGAESGRLLDRAGNIRLDNLQAPDDVDAVIRQTARYNNEFAVERRNNVTPGELLRLAEDMGKDARWLDVKAIGDAFNYEEIVAARKLLITSTNDIRARAIETAEGGDPLELAKAFAKHEMIMGKVAGATAEWGRAGHAFRALNEITQSSDFQAIDQALREQGRSYDELLQLARSIKYMETPGEISNVVAANSNRLQKGIVYVVTNGYLSGLFTHAGYFGGNYLRNILHIPGTALEAGVATVRRALGGADTDRVYWREVPASLYGLMHGSMSAWGPALDAWRNGTQPALPGQRRSAHPSYVYSSPFPDTAIGNAATEVFGWPQRMVSAIHQYSRSVFYTQEVYRNAVRDALDRHVGIEVTPSGVREAVAERAARLGEAQGRYEAAVKALEDNGLEGRALQTEIKRLGQYPTDDLMDKAAAEADKQVYQQRLPYKSMFSALGRWTDDHPYGRIIFPFINVGYNYAKQRMRLSVGAPFVEEYRSALLGKAGGAEFDKAMGKVVFGTTLLGTGAFLAANGLMTGPGPSEPKAREEWLKTHQPNSIAIGDIWVPVGGLGAHFDMLNFAAGMFQASQFLTKDDIGHAAVNYWKVIMHMAVSESVFNDFANVGKAISDHTGLEATKFIAGVVGGAVPFSSMLSQANRHIFDPHEKQTTPITENPLLAVWDNVLSRVPLASETLYNRRDSFGEIKTAHMGLLDPAWREALEQKYRNDPTVRWLDRLQTGPGPLPHRIDGVQLSPVQYDDYARVSGKLTKDILDEIHPALENAPRGVQMQEISKQVKKARHIARMMLYEYYPQLPVAVTNERLRKFD